MYIKNVQITNKNKTPKVNNKVVTKVTYCQDTGLIFTQVTSSQVKVFIQTISVSLLQYC